MSHKCTSCSCPPLSTGLDQTLDELDFERGIWQAAYYGDVQKINTFLSKGIDVNTKDSSGYVMVISFAKKYLNPKLI